MRRRLALGLVLTVLLGACGMPEEEVTSGSTTTAAPGAGWEQLPPSPLSPRGGATLTTLEDGRLLVVGGDMVADCIDHRAARSGNSESGEPAAASAGPAVIRVSTLSCVPPREDPRLNDGAILDSATGEWRQIADAPAPLSDQGAGVVIGDTVYFWTWPSIATDGPTQGTWMSYDVSEDEWRKLASPPVATAGKLVRAGDRVIAYPGSEERGPVNDHVYDPATKSWTALPRDPLSPSFDRSMVWTGREVVLLGHEMVPNPGSERPSLVRAAVLDPDSQQWRRLPDSEILGGYEWWSWSGGRVVNAVDRTGDGGAVRNYGRDYAHGGMLDPANGEWSELPDGRPGHADCHGDGATFETDVRFHAVGPDTVVTEDAALHLSESRWEAIPCNPEQPAARFSSTWAFDGLVVFGGYEVFSEEGKLNRYEFSNETWLWRPSGG